MILKYTQGHCGFCCWTGCNTNCGRI